MKYFLIVIIIIICKIDFCQFLFGGIIVKKTFCCADEAPFVALITNGPFHLCTGAILTNQHFITAAHCFHINNSKIDKSHNLWVWVGGTTHDTHRDPFAIKEIFIHPEYDSSLSMFINDLAIFTITELLEFDLAVRPIVISDVTVKGINASNKLYSFYGWGDISEYEEASDLGTQKFMACDSGTAGEIFCAFSNSSVTCEGDSGGPIVTKGMTLKPTLKLLGICHGQIGSGHTCSHNNSQPSIFVNVSFFKDWIYATVMNQRNSNHSDCLLINPLIYIFFLIHDI